MNIVFDKEIFLSNQSHDNHFFFDSLSSNSIIQTEYRNKGVYKIKVSL